MKNKKIVLLSLATGIALGFVFSSLFQPHNYPKNCAEIGQVYLEIAKQEKHITDYGSEEWIKIVDDETKIVNDCYSSLK